jgi:hypothetical protein
MAGAIAAIQEKLRKYPDLRSELGADFIEILPGDDRGFMVGLHDHGGTISVYSDGWHEDDFKDKEEALDCFALCLSDGARLKVLSRGGFDYCWTLEVREESEWVRYSTTALLFFPFWRRRVTRFLQNRLVSVPSL